MSARAPRMNGARLQGGEQDTGERRPLRVVSHRMTNTATETI